jgi:hypothetical protein
MKSGNEYKTLFWMTGIFLLAYFLPLEKTVFTNAIFEALRLLKWYAREHVILCLIPAFFIAGVISVFISQASVIKYFGAQAKQWMAYSVASVSGTILAVCSCTILPIFASIYKRGAGLGPAIAFLYSGPAINILAIILTARVLGIELGIARVVGAVSFGIVIGLMMAFIYRKEETDKQKLVIPEAENERPLWQTAVHFGILIALLISATWGRPETPEGVIYMIWQYKWWITSVMGIFLALSLIFILGIRVLNVIIASVFVVMVGLVFPGQPLLIFSTGIAASSVVLYKSEGEPKEWLMASWDFAKLILPLLALGVLAAGFLLGTPEGGRGIIPPQWINGLVGGNSITANLVASVIGAFMYFATLTEIPILQALLASGMGKGPALALLLAGPALSLPNMLVIRGVIGTQKTLVFVILVVVMATLSGLVFGAL